MKNVRIALATVLTAVALAVPATSNAEPGMGCERINWGPFGWQYRTICDLPKRPDGSWMRARRVWTPAKTIAPYCNYYTCSGRQYFAENTVAFETYPVTDQSILPDEPGWLPTGSVTIR